MISSFISSYSLAHYLWYLPCLTFESVRDLEINTSILFSLDFANDTILSCFFYFFLIIDLYFLIPAVIAQMFNLILELITPIEIPIKEAKAEIETHSVIVEAKV